eukprot:3042815-Prymnesium_polylepis.1
MRNRDQPLRSTSRGGSRHLYTCTGARHTKRHTCEAGANDTERGPTRRITESHRHRLSHHQLSMAHMPARKLSPDWRPGDPAGDRLATDWRPAGDRLATNWRPTVATYVQPLWVNVHTPFTRT